MTREDLIAILGFGGLAILYVIVILIAEHFK
jgi:hypothetical protein